MEGCVIKDLYLDLTRRKLKRLNQYKKQLNDYENMRDELLEINAIDNTKERLSPTYIIFSDTEDKAIRLHKLNILIKRLKSKICMIEFNLGKLDEIDKKLLILRYVEGWRILNISESCNYSYDYTRQKIKRALRKIKKLMYE